MAPVFTLSPVGRFAVRVFLWLPVCFGAWYFSSILFTLPLTSLLDVVMRWLFTQVIEQIGPQGNAISVATRILLPVPDSASGASGDVTFAINPLKYGYCIPFYTALVLASPGEDGRKILFWIVGLLILTLTQAFGVGAEIIKILAFQLGEPARAQLGIGALGLELTALAYQLGFLILPSVTPLVIWAWQFRDFIREQQLAPADGH